MAEYKLKVYEHSSAFANKNIFYNFKKTLQFFALRLIFIPKKKPPK